MKTLYQVLNVDLANEFTKKRKIARAKELVKEKKLLEEILELIEAMDIPDDDDRHHWIQVIGRKAAADLLTLGKVQPEHMLEMASLPLDDFKEAVKVATSTARKLNDTTVEAEKELNLDTIANAVI